MAMHHSDVILAVGARFDDRVTNTVSKFVRAQKSFYRCRSSVVAIVPVDVPIVGPVTTVLKISMRRLIQLASSERNTRCGGIADWWIQIDNWRAAHGCGCRRYGESDFIMPQDALPRCMRRPTARPT